MTCPCDCPDLPPDLVARLMAAATENTAKLVVAATAAGIQPTFMLCHSGLLPVLSAALSAGERRVRGWCHCQRAIEVMFDDDDAFRNLNTPDDLAVRQS